MLNPDERARVEATAKDQIKASCLPLISPEMKAALLRATGQLFNPHHAPEIHAIMLDLMPTLAPWFQTVQGRPIWLTPEDRAFLKVNRISDQ